MSFKRNAQIIDELLAAMAHDENGPPIEEQVRTMLAISNTAAVYTKHLMDLMDTTAKTDTGSSGLEIALRNLANEASGFLALSDIERHGYTNSKILRLRIEEARDALLKAVG